MTDIKVKAFETGEAEIFYRMAALFHGSDAVAYGEINPQALSNTFYDCTNNSPYISGFFVCCDNEICGYLLITFSYSNEYGGKIMIIDEIFILEEHRGRGIAYDSIKSVISKYIDDVVYVEVEVKKDNEKAIDLYKKFDFKFNDYLLMYKFFNRTNL